MTAEFGQEDIRDDALRMEAAEEAGQIFDASIEALHLDITELNEAYENATSDEERESILARVSETCNYHKRLMVGALAADMEVGFALDELTRPDSEE
jgi:hypothetical protein